jgi:rubrerythrin
VLESESSLGCAELSGGREEIGMDVRKIFEYALQREYEGKRFFEVNAQRLQHAAAVDTFKKLAAEEQKHIEFVMAQLAALDAGRSADSAMGEELEKTGFFSQRAASESLDQTVLEAMVPDLPILRMAYLIEQDFTDFYEQFARKTNGEERAVLEKLASWERRHAALFKQMHDQAFEAYAQMPWGG